MSLHGNRLLVIVVDFLFPCNEDSVFNKNANYQLYYYKKNLIKGGHQVISPFVYKITIF